MEEETILRDEYLTQDRAPILEALTKMKQARLVPFDVPGHKRGRGNRELADFLGQACLDVDVNSMKPLDNLCHPSQRHSRRRNFGGGGIRRGAQLPYGRRDDFRRASHDFVYLQARR